MSKNSYLILIPSLSRGGAEVMAYQYWSYLKKKGYSVDFLLIENRVDFELPETRIFIEGSGTLTSFLFHKRTVKTRHYSRIISIIPLYTCLFILKYRLNLATIRDKFTFTVHNNVAFDFEEGHNRKVRWLYYKLLKRSKRVYCVSNGLTNQLVASGIDGANTIYNKSKFTYDFVNRNSRPLSIIMVGRFAEQKGYDRLPYIVNTLESMGLLFTIDIYGEGAYQRDILTGLKNVSIHPYTERIEEIFMEKEVNILLSLSRWEGFGLVLLEAISKGIYVVSTNCDFGPSEILGISDVGGLIDLDEDGSVLRAFNKAIKWLDKSEEYKIEQTLACYNFFREKSNKQWELLEL